MRRTELHRYLRDKDVLLLAVELVGSAGQMDER